MPERPERFFWLYARQLDNTAVSTINDIHHQFTGEWQECPLEWIACVEGGGPSNRLWLFRLQCGIGNGGLASKFSRKLREYVQTLEERLNLSKDRIKQRTNLPTPLLCEPVGEWPKTDIGLHVVNDVYNGMLITYSYHSRGTRMQPPHLQTGTLRRLMSTIEYVWRAASCDCHGGTCHECSGDGCYSCFQRDCANCEGTGWKNFSRWVRGRFKVNYSTGFPIAEL